MAKHNIFYYLDLWWQDHHQANESEKQNKPRSWRNWLPTPGNTIFTLALVFVLFWAQSAGAMSLLIPAISPSSSSGTIAYQGRLADSAGNPLTNTLNMSFRLYAAATGGTALWTEQWTGSNGVQVSDGLFNVMLGSLTPIPQNVIAANSHLFLGITAGTDDEMSPRVQLGSVPFAVQALTVPDGSITTEKIADGAVRTRNLGVDAGSSCLTDQVKFDVPAKQMTVVPGLNLSFTLDKPSKVLIWMDGIGHSVQGPPENEDVGYYLIADGSSIGGSLDVDSNYWKDLKATRMVNMTSGTHHIGVSVISQKPASFWIWGAPNSGFEACIFYLVLGS